ncbi:MAG: aspartate kinase [Chlorobi bacterium]|nr:aspartate kinase [Chlorobiota bacterium]
MIVYKFGGASVRDAEGVRNLASIVNGANERLVVVVSAMGKTTNAMEQVALSYFNGEKDIASAEFENVKRYHINIVRELFGSGSGCESELQKWFQKLFEKLNGAPSLNYDFEYDQIVPFGEMFSTLIVSHYLNLAGTKNKWIDIRTLLKTNEQYREAETDWELTGQLMLKHMNFNEFDIYVTQGFIGGTVNNLSTTLGREGSDYTSAVLGYVFDADSVSIWKDVPGVLNADPRWYPEAEKIEKMSYREAIELSFYGAQVIHPKTIKPLENKKIPLFVRSFVEPGAMGTKIYDLKGHVDLPPVYILKKDQILLTISPKDFSFIVENNLSEIFSIFSRRRVKINLMHNSAINFSVCINRMDTLNDLVNELQDRYVVRYNENLELISIRHYTDDSIKKILKGKDIIDSQVSRNTARYVVRKSEWKF